VKGDGSSGEGDVPDIKIDTILTIPAAPVPPTTRPKIIIGIDLPEPLFQPINLSSSL
jgi:hypothetical protein